MTMSRDAFATANNLGQDKLGAYGDDFYQALMEAHEALTSEESMRFNARLVLLMANQIGDPDLLTQILAAAGASGRALESRQQSESES